jgi:hypothetical protein
MLPGSEKPALTPPCVCGVQLEDVQGLKLQGYQLDDKACTALSALKKLRMLLLEGSIAPAVAPVVLSGLSNLRHLCLQGPATPPPPGTPSHSLKLQVGDGGIAYYCDSTTVTVPI